MASTVTVTISLDSAGNLRVAPDPFILHKHQDEVVKWQLDPGLPSASTFIVEFKDESPFHESQFSKDHPVSGLARRSLVTDKTKVYKYSVGLDGKFVDPGGVADK
jgi:hypothetical protein